MQGLRDYIYNIDTSFLRILEKSIILDDGVYMVNFSESSPYRNMLFDLLDKPKFQSTIRALTSHVDNMKLIVGDGCSETKVLDMFWKPDMYYVDDGKD